MSKKAFERKLAAVEALRSGPASKATMSELRKALADRSNYLVSKAARVVAERGFAELQPDLLAAYDRFFDNPLKTDPQCWAKNAISKALVDLGHDEAAPYLRGLTHIQMEPVWGGSEDTAGTLRGNCALALAQCRDIGDREILAHLVESLVDPNHTVRLEAARSIGRLNNDAGALLLRLRALVGDKEPEPLGACFSSLLAIEGRQAIEFVSHFLDAGGETAAEAALALGMIRDAEAYGVLKGRWQRERNITLADTLLTAIGLTRLPEAVDFLVQLVAEDSSSAEAAIEALGWARSDEQIRKRLGAAVDSAGSPRLSQLYRERFPDALSR